MVYEQHQYPNQYLIMSLFVPRDLKTSIKGDNMIARERNPEEFIRHSSTLLLEKEGRFHRNCMRQHSTTQPVMHVLEAPSPPQC